MKYMQTAHVEHLPRAFQIGRQTETGVRELRIDVSPWLDRWPGMYISFIVNAPQSSIKYPAIVRMDGTMAVWEITDSDTAQAGTGSVEIVGWCEDKQVVSASAEVIVLARTPGTGGEAPEYAKPWLDQVIEAGEVAQAGAEAARNASENASDFAGAAEVAARNAQDAAAEAEMSLSGKLDKQQGVENVRKLLYISEDGTVKPLMLGAGLDIVDGVLTITGAVPPEEAIQLVEQPDGTVLVQGVAFVEQADGSVLWSGAAFVEQADGSVLVG